MTSNFAARNFWKQSMARNICAAQLELAGNADQQYAYTGRRYMQEPRAPAIYRQFAARFRAGSIFL
jgi:hypothetical protein